MRGFVLFGTNTPSLVEVFYGGDLGMNLKPIGLAVAVAIAGCGGGGGGSSGGVVPASSKASGMVSKGPVAGAQLFVFKMDATGQADGAAVVGPITTAADGSWSVSIPNSVPRPLLVTSNGGTYTDEATGASVSAGALNSLLPEGANTVAVTPVSELLVRNTRQYLVDNPAVSLSDSIDAGREKINQVFGVSFDPLSSLPSAGADADEQSLQYAALLGGLSTLANNESAATDPFETVLAVIEDASDGAIDGQKDGAPIEIEAGTNLPSIDGDDLVGAVGDYTSNTSDGDFSTVTAFTVSASADANGNVSPTSVSVFSGAAPVFTLAADEGFHVVGASGCSGNISGNKFISDALSSVCSLSVTFAINEYAVTVEDVDGGSVNPGSVSVDHGETAAFTFAADIGYDLTGATGCGGSLSGSTYTTGLIAQDCTITPTFALKTYSVTTTSNGDGTLDPAGASVAHGSTTSFNVTPGLGSLNDSVTASCGNGSLADVNGQLVYTTPAITESCQITASFSLQQFSVTTSITGFGSATPPSTTVAYGNQTAITLTADANNVLTSASGCGGSLAGDVFTTAAITGNCAIAAVFSPVTYVVITTASNGSFTPENPAVDHGQAQAFTLTPDEGYELTGVSGCGGMLAGNVFTTAEVTAACEVTATYQLAVYNVTAASNAGGMVSPNSQPVPHGGNASFTVTADSGFEISSISGCGGLTAGAGDTYATTNTVTDDCAVNVVFAEQGGALDAVWNSFNWDQANWQ